MKMPQNFSCVYCKQDLRLSPWVSMRVTKSEAFWEKKTATDLSMFAQVSTEDDKMIRPGRAWVRLDLRGSSFRNSLEVMSDMLLFIV